MLAPRVVVLLNKLRRARRLEHLRQELDSIFKAPGGRRRIEDEVTF